METGGNICLIWRPGDQLLTLLKIAVLFCFFKVSLIPSQIMFSVLSNKYRAKSFLLGTDTGNRDQTHATTKLPTGHYLQTAETEDKKKTKGERSGEFRCGHVLGLNLKKRKKKKVEPGNKTSRPTPQLPASSSKTLPPQASTTLSKVPSAKDPLFKHRSR